MDAKQPGPASAPGAEVPTIRVPQALRRAGSRAFPTCNRGARLRVVADRQVPDIFVLVLSNAVTLSRACRVVWRNSGEMGVEFTAAPAGSNADEPRAEGDAEWMLARPTA